MMIVRSEQILRAHTHTQSAKITLLFHMLFVC